MKTDELNKIKPGAKAAVAARCLVWVFGLVLLGGCRLFTNNDYVKNISSVQPEVATEAMNKAAEKKDRQAIVPLVKRLYDEDPVIRLTAIKALKNITGEDMGYHSYEPEVKRIAAIKRWEAWLIEQKLVAGENQP